MVSESAPGSVGQNESAPSECLMDSVGSEDSSVAPEQTSVGGGEDGDGVEVVYDANGDEDSENVVDSMGSDGDGVEVFHHMNNDGDGEHMVHNMSSETEDKYVVHSINRYEDQIGNDKKVREFLRAASSNASSESGYTRESDSDLSLMYGNSQDGLEDVLQMGCLDFVFLPPGAKPKSQKKQMFKYNNKGKKELNINVKGALALGLEAQMKDAHGLETEMINDPEKRKIKPAMSFGSKFQDTMSCGPSAALKGITKGIKLYEEVGREDYMSIMSLSQESSEETEVEEEEDDNSVVSENFVLPQARVQANLLQQQIQKQIQEQMKLQQQEEELQRLRKQNEEQQQRIRDQQRQILQQQQQQQFQGYYQPQYQVQHYEQQMGLHILNGNQRFESALQSMPMQSLPSQIIVGEQSVFEEASYLSYDNKVAPDPPHSSALAKIVEDDYSEEESDSSMVACNSSSSMQENPSFDAPKKSPKKKKKLSKLDRWKKANNKRLEKSEIGVDSTREEENSVDSQQATYSIESSSSASDKKESKDEGISKTVPTPKNANGQTLAFDSIFTRRLERRRATKLKNNDSEEEAIKSVSENVHQPATKLDEKKHSKEQPFDINSDSSASSDGIPAPTPKIQKADPPVESPHDSSVIDAVAAAAASVLKEEFQLLEKPDFENEDTENRVPPHPTLTDKEDKTDSQPSKNPFQDVDALDEEEDRYDDEADAYPLLTKSSSDHEDVSESVLQVVSSPKGTPLSPLNSATNVPSPSVPRRMRTVVPMTPSPRFSTQPSPRLYSQWSSSMHSLTSKMAAASLRRRMQATKMNRLSGGGEVQRADSMETEFFDCN